jgi:hypothetical protein
MAADEVEVVAAMEEEEVADGDDVIRLQKETTRRGCITAWSVFLAQYPYEAWQRGAGVVNCLFLHIFCTSREQED